ncbi:ATP-grasp domain-containing protein [soil metagenome]
MKKILVLVASETNLPAIKAAKRLGYYVITCDNNEKNIGHRFADENIFIDVYDTERILEEVQNKEIDAVVTFVSAHGLKSASIISQKLKLSGYSQKGLDILLNKGLFRDYQKQSGLKFPRYQLVNSLMQVDIVNLTYPSIIKPADQGGSKGVAVIRNKAELEEYFNRADNRSETDSFIIEEYLVSEDLINGECIIQNGRVLASFIGDYIFDKKVTDVIPVATLFPSQYKAQKVLAQISTIVDDLKIPNGLINFEVIIKGDEAYIVEINPRPSGNYLWKLMGHHFNCNIAEVIIKQSLGEYIDESVFILKEMKSHYAYQLFYSSKNQTFRQLDLPQNLQESIIDIKWFYSPGEDINVMKSLYDRVGIALLEIKDEEQYCNYFENLDFFRIKNE